MKAAPITMQVPLKTQVVDEIGNISRPWGVYLLNLEKSLVPLGIEKSFELTNNNAVAADIEGLSFDAAKVSQAAVDYLIQRVTTGGGAVEKIETGTFFAAYLPTSNNWVLSEVPSTAGITLTVTSGGQIQYTSTNETGAPSISKLTYKARTLSAKNSQYSEAGR